VQSVAEDPNSLAQLLAGQPNAWVVTGGPLSLARPFLSKARIASVAAVAVLSERTDPRGRTELDYGRLAAIRAIPPVDAFHAAAAASRAGFSVWDPDLNASSEVTRLPLTASPLSPRERTILELAGSGLSTKAVARQLGISPNTVKFHLQSAFVKLDVTTRAEAVMAAMRRGELSV
jgi:DNA-binding CsgD family transcriptional regulator